jgi:hypothetical protein
MCDMQSLISMAMTSISKEIAAEVGTPSNVGILLRKRLGAVCVNLARSYADETAGL